MIYFISGHRDITEEDFEKYYITQINKVLLKDIDPHFVVGDYRGADIMAQNYLVSCHLEDKVTVYHMFTEPRNIAPGITKTVGGFEDDVSRDSKMTEVSDFDIAYYNPEKGNSGTFQNIERRLGKIK